MKKNIFYTLCLLFLVGNLYSQQTVWVASAAAGTADGSSQANAFGSFTNAFVQINSAGDVLRVVGNVPASGQSLNKNFAYTIEGDAGGSTLTGTAGAVRMFTNNTTSTGSQNVTFKNIKFTGATGSTGTGGGGVLYSNQANTINFENCRFEGNSLVSTVTTGGGALFITLTTVTITDCLFKENTALSKGGAIGIATGANVTLTRCTFYKNSTTSTTGNLNAAALWVVTGAVVNGYNCTFFQNTTGNTNQDYGVIRTDGGTTKVYNSLFYDNKLNTNVAAAGDWGSAGSIGSTLTNSLAQKISVNVTNTNSTVSPTIALASSNLSYDDTSGKVRFRVAAVGDATPIAFGSDGKDVGAWDCGTRVAPTFTQVDPICSGATLSLPTTSTNGITGVWSPALNNTATTEYTFTPAVGQCASSTATMTITVNSNVTTTFAQVAAICSGASLSALPTTSTNTTGITGTWSPALNNTATTEYTFTPTAGLCASTATMTITVNPATTTGSVTRTQSTGSYVWPANGQTYTATGIYTYVSGCNTATLDLTINTGLPPDPDESTDAPIITSLTSNGTTVITQGCVGTTLVIKGNYFVGVTAVTVNGVAVASYVVNSATQITATLPAGAIASGAVVVTTSLGGASTTGGNFAVNANVTPSFTQVDPICSGGSLSALPTTSDNSITGTWSPALNNAATTAYTFTPTAGQCATTAVMTITVNSNVTPTFTAVAAICSGASLSALPTTSNNSVTGTWSPAINNTATTEYTFTPTEGLCATTATMTITVNACPDTFTWNGSSSSDWATAANWTKTTGTGPDGFPGQTPGRSIDNVIISNGGTPVIASGTYVIYSLAVNNATGVDTGSILTIDSGATLTVNNTSATLAAVAITLKGGSIVNNGTLNATATNTGGSFGIACLVPSVAPSTATEYGYSGSGALNITTTLGNVASGGIQFNGTTANTTYKMLFNGTTTFNLNNTALAVYALRVVDGAKNPIIIGGAGFTLGTVGAPVNNGLLIMGNNGNSVTVNTGTTLTLNSAATNTAMGISIVQTADASADVNFTNKGTVAILGASSNAGINLSVNNGANVLPAINKINFVNEGTVNVDVAIGSSSNNASLRVAGAGSTAGLVTITNTGTGVLNLKNSQPFTAVTGCPIRILATANTPAVTITNAGALTSTGQSINFGGSATKSSINNTGTIVSSSEFQNFTVTNGTAGTITFNYNTPATTRSVAFTVLAGVAASAGATYTDVAGNVYTVIFTKAGTSLVGSFPLTGTTTPAPASLTKTAGTGDASIAYSAINLIEASPLSAANSAFTNNGTVNTGTATNLNTFAAVTTSGTSVIAPGGTSGVGNTDIANASTVALNGTLKLDIQSIVSSTAFDQITNSATGGGFDITNATLDLTGIFTPLGNRNINIVTTNATGTLTGNFASVIGLESKPRWSVNYITGTNGKVQLIYFAEPTVTSLTSDGTIAITEACGGSTLVIKGTDLSGATAVTVNGVAVASFVVDSATQITAILPASSTGTGNVVVTTPGGTGTSAGNFAVIAAPNAGTDGTLSVCVGTTLTDNVLFARLTGAAAGGTWTNEGLVYTYTVNATAPCTGSDTATVTVTEQAAPASAGANGSLVICAGTSVSASTLYAALTETPATGGTWSATTGGAGTYTYTQAGGSCPNNAATVTVTEQAAPNAGTDATLSVCAGTTPSESQLFAALTAADAGGTWTNEGLVYTYTVNAITPCTVSDTATVTVTVQAAPNAGTNGTLSLSASPSDEALFAALTGAATGGSWSRPGSGYVGVYTYTVNATSPCTVNATSIVTVTASTEIPTGPLSLCKGATVASVTGTTSLKFYAASTGGSPLIGTTALATKTYFVTETISGSETPRVSLSVIVNLLPATPSALVSTESGLICKYIGSTTPVTFTATTVNASSYIWTAPIGATIEPDGAQAFISFEGVSTTPGLIGSVSVRIVDANGCVSLPKALALTTKLPTAPTALTMTSEDTTPLFKGAAVVPATVPVSYTTVGLNSLVKITKVGPYMGTSTVFTLTAPAAVTAGSYAWTLPTGVNQLSGGTSNVITVDFADVTPGTAALPIVVQSVGGCGSSTNRTLTLARAIPTAPTALVLTNTTETILSALTKISKVGPYTGTEIPFTLTATPFTTQGSEATSYAWILPAGVNCITENSPTLVNTGTVLVPVMTAAIATEVSTIEVDFNGVTPGITPLSLKVFAVNGSGNSLTRTLALQRSLPTAPTALVLKDEDISTTAAVTKVGPYTGKATSLTLTATPFLTQGAEATSFKWVLPNGVNVIAGADEVADELVGSRTWTGTETVLTIDLAGIGTGILAIPLSVYAVNGAGTSSTVRTLSVTAAVPATPAIVGSTGTTFSRCVTTTYTATSIPGATYTWVVPTDAVIEGPTTGNVIVVNYAAVTMAVSAPVAVTCYATNGTGNSITKSLIVKRVAGCREASAAIADEFSVTAYPNPSSSEFTIESSAKGAMSVKVYDMQGRLVEKADTNRVGSRLAAGTYNVIVNQGANVKTLRVIKQ